jgi:Ca2+-binding EF-hand superfamily protein
MRFSGMDTNHDGQISRGEWRGNDASFNEHDWNGDGVLSGIEVTPGAQRPVDFTSLDRNHDNRISPSEWPGNRAIFDLLDADRNGFLSQTEFGQYGGLLATNRLQDLFRALDANHDNRIGRAEWPAAFPTAIFNVLDTNHDTFLTLEEIRRIGHDPEGQLENIFNALDTNHDQRISPAEWPGDRTLFDRLDKNHDGFLTLAELRQGSSGDDDDDDDDQGELRATFNSLDANHDNRISRSEWRGGSRLFNRLDTNHDNFLSWTEFSTRGHH